MEDKFQKAMDLGWDAQRDAMRKYGASSIQEALVIKNFGRSKYEYYCDSCGCSISKEQANKTEERATLSTHARFHCNSCKKAEDKRLDKLNQRDQKRFDRL